MYGITVIAGQRTINESNGISALELDLIRVKGRAQPTHIYTLADLFHADADCIRRLKSSHERFLAAYRSQQWESAESSLRECRALGIADLEPYYTLFASRISANRTNPPPVDWDGAFTALEK